MTFDAWLADIVQMPLMEARVTQVQLTGEGTVALTREDRAGNAYVESRTSTRPPPGWDQVKRLQGVDRGVPEALPVPEDEHKRTEIQLAEGAPP